MRFCHCTNQCPGCGSCCQIVCGCQGRGSQFVPVTNTNTSPPVATPEPPKDLRGQRYRAVGRDDSVTITGAEYLRKSHERDALTDEVERLRAALREISHVEFRSTEDMQQFAREALS